MFFKDRREAGRLLAAQLTRYQSRPDVLVLGIPRGGMVLAAEVAHSLQAPLDVLLTHKIGAPFNPELAVGAVTEDGTVFLDEALIHQLGIPARLVEWGKQAQLRDLARRASRYRGGKAPLERRDRIAILCDDGIATGSTTVAGLRALAAGQPARRVLAAPVAPSAVARRLAHECDEAVFLATPEPFHAVGLFYAVFDQVSDEEVVELLRQARERGVAGP